MAFTPKLGKPADASVLDRVQKRTQPDAAPDAGAGGIFDFLKKADTAVTDVGKGAVKGAGSTLFNIGKLEQRGVNKVKELFGGEATPLKETPEILKPKNTAESIGYGAEQIGEFFIPGGAALKAGKAADVAIKGSKLLSGASRTAKVARGTARTVSRSAIEGGSAGAVSLAQSGGDVGEAGVAAGIGAALPPAARVAQGLIRSTPAIASALSGVPRETIQRAADPVIGKRIAAAIKQVGENKTQPYFGLTNDIAGTVQKAGEKAGQFVKKAVGQFSAANKDKTFDVAAKFDDVVTALEPFRTSGIIVPRKGRGFKIAATEQSPFTQREVGELNKLLEKLRVSKSIRAEDVLALKRSFATAYDAVSLGVNGNPRPYHAAVMALKEKADETIQSLLPKELRQAFGQYTRYERFMEKFGNKLVDAEGNVKPNAEQFISNLGNLNKGEVRKLAAEFTDFMGRDIADEVEIIKDAQKLSPLFAATGSRTQDVLRSALGIGLVGGTAVAPQVTIPALVATSPKVQGKVLQGISAVRANAPKMPLSDAIRSRLLGGETGGTPISKAMRDRYNRAVQKTK